MYNSFMSHLLVLGQKQGFVFARLAKIDFFGQQVLNSKRISFLLYIIMCCDDLEVYVADDMMI